MGGRAVAHPQPWGPTRSFKKFLGTGVGGQAPSLQGKPGPVSLWANTSTGSLYFGLTSPAPPPSSPTNPKPHCGAQQPQPPAGTRAQQTREAPPPRDTPVPPLPSNLLQECPGPFPSPGTGNCSALERLRGRHCLTRAGSSRGNGTLLLPRRTWPQPHHDRARDSVPPSRDTALVSSYSGSGRVRSCYHRSGAAAPAPERTPTRTDHLRATAGGATPLLSGLAFRRPPRLTAALPSPAGGPVAPVPYNSPPRAATD